MYREINHIYRRLNIAADALIAAFSYLAAMYLSVYVSTGSYNIPAHMLSYGWLLYVVTALWPTLLIVNGLYPTNRLRGFAETAKIILHSAFYGLMAVLALLFLFKAGYVSRLLLLNFFAISTLAFIAKESIVRWYAHTVRRSGANQRNILIVGDSHSSGYIIKKIEEDKSLGLKIVGILSPLAEDVELKTLRGHNVIGHFHDIEHVLSSHIIDNVIITTYFTSDQYDSIEKIISACEEWGVEVWLPARLFHTKIGKPEGDEFLDIPLFVFRTEPKFSWQILIKMAMDRISALLLLILLSPVIIIAALLIKLTSPGPVIFKQKRCGYHGRIFTFYKLRSMYKDAEETQAEHMGKNIMTGPIFKMERDPRITPIGRFLRKTSIDELPQLWNVLKGEMSMVGPRPPIPNEVTEYKGWHRRRLSMKPGITGLLQVSGRSDVVNFDKWVDYDLEYIDHWSLWFDTEIIFRTIFVVLSTRGAK